MFAPHDEMSLPVLASISSTVGSVSFVVCREDEPSAGPMENKHVPIHVDGNPSGFAKLNAPRKTRPILDFFIPCNRRRSNGISTAARQQCHDQPKTRHNGNGAQSSNHFDLKQHDQAAGRASCLNGGTPGGMILSKTGAIQPPMLPVLIRLKIS